MGIGHYGSERTFAVKPARQRRCPYGLRGLTAQRAQASWLSCQKYGKSALSGQASACPTYSFIQPCSSSLINYHNSHKMSRVYLFGLHQTNSHVV